MTFSHCLDLVVALKASSKGALIADIVRERPPVPSEKERSSSMNFPQSFFSVFLQSAFFDPKYLVGGEKRPCQDLRIRKKQMAA